MSNLKYDMKKACLDYPFADGNGKQIQDKDTARTYRRAINSFCTWAKDTYGINNRRQLEASGGVVQIIQAYANKLLSDGKSASTIHTYLSPVCKGLGIHLNDIKKPARKACDISRSRGYKNPQGAADSRKPAYSRLVEFQKMTGLRRSELANLKVNSFTRDESGCLCVIVEHGKGGKKQLQRILPEDKETLSTFMKPVMEALAGIPGNRNKIPLFTTDELKNKIDLHGIRAEQARRAYYYYERCQTADGRKEVQQELVARWNACHCEKDHIVQDGEDFLSTSPKGRKFITEFSHNGMYRLRGDNKERCFREGRPIAYDRTALLAVSVFHLAHWRNDVTVKHYML